jgi:hypothetical protein
MCRLWVVVFIAVLSLGCKQAQRDPIFVQKRPEGATQGRNLDPKTRPLVELDPYRDQEFVSVSQYDSHLESAPCVNRVFRFSFKSKVSDAIAAAKEQFPESEGWIYSEGTPFIVSRDYVDGPVASHSMIIATGRVERDEQAYTKAAVYQDLEYTRVSLNEAQRPLSAEPLKRIKVFSQDMNQSQLVDVPSSAHIQSYERKGSELTVTLSAAPVDDGSQQILEVWLQMGSKDYVVVVQVSEEREPLKGISELTTRKAALLGAEQQIGAVDVRWDGRSVTLSGLEPELKETLIVSRWVPPSVPDPLVIPRVIDVRVSSITIDQGALPAVRPNLSTFFGPLNEEYKLRGGR